MEEIRALAPYYVSKLDVSGEKGAGVTLIKIFANMLKLVIDRLNRVPDKNFIAFLDMLGIKLLPAQPARAPVTFYLSEGATETVMIPEKSQTSAEEIVFETEKNIVATPSKIVKAYSISVDKDGIFASPPNVVPGEITTPFSTTLTFDVMGGEKKLFLDDVSGLKKEEVLKIEDKGIEYAVVSEVSETRVDIMDKLLNNHDKGTVVSKITTFELFEGKNRQEHILYLGHEDLFNIKGEATITIKVTNSQSASNLGNPDFVQWEYWGEAIRTEDTKEIKEVDWHPLTIDTSKAPISLQKTGWTDTKGQTWKSGEIKECEINTIKSRWIRCKLKTPISKETKLPTINTIGVEIENSVSPDMLFHNDVPLDMALTTLTYKLTSSVSAGATSIELNDVTGLEKWDILKIVDHGKVEEVTISNISNKTIKMEESLQYAHSSDVLVKKYKDFYPFGRKPRIFDTFYIGCSDAFSKKGASITLTFSIKPEHDVPIIRVHGIGKIFADKLEAADPPIHTVEELLKYTPQQLAAILDIKQIKTAVNILEAAKKAFHDKTLQNKKEDEKEELPSQDSQGELSLSWEYCNGEGWIVIKDLDDKTDRFLLNGKKKVIFTCPSDIKTVKVNGQENYWIRVKIVDGDYGKEKFKEENGTWRADTSQINPPVINKLTITYAPGSQNLQHRLTYNNLEFKDVTEESKTENKPFEPFQPLDDEHQTLYLGFDKKIEKGPISIFFSLEEQEFLVEDMPKIEWYYYSQDKKWVRLEGLDDTTQNLTRTGAVKFIVPAEFAKTSKFGDELYWFKAVDIEDKFRTQSSKVKGIYLNTTFAIQAESIEDEIIGSSNGTAKQEFEFVKVHVIEEEIWVNEIGTLLEEEKKKLIEENGKDSVSESKDENGKTTEVWVRWRAVEDFFDSTSKSRHYVVDRTTGKIKFGDGVHGMVPPIGRDNIKANYRIGGGEKGNVGATEISAMKTSIPFVDRVTNPEAAGGGADIEILGDAMERGPWVVKHRNRAVTVEDFEWLARQASRKVVRVKCMRNATEGEEGRVTVIIVPESKEDKPTPLLELKNVVEKYLLEHCSNVVSLQVEEPVYIEVSATADVFPVSIDMAPLAEKEALKRLNEFLHPLTGGENGKGWEFGRLVCLSDIYTLLEGIAEIDHVENVTVRMVRAEEGERTIVTPETWIPGGLICSGEHRTSIKFKGKEAI